MKTYNQTTLISKDTDEKDDHDINVGIIVSVICFTVLLICIIVLIIIMKRRKQSEIDAAKKIGQEQATNRLGVLNNTYELNENPTYDALQGNNQNNISIVIDSVTTTDDKKYTNDDHTLNFFLNNVESTISEKELKFHPKLNLKKSQLVTDSTKDTVLCGFLKSFESADMSPSSNKKSTDNITEESNTRL